MSVLAYLATAAVFLPGQTESLDAARIAASPARPVIAASLNDVDEDYFYQGEYLGSVRALGGEIVRFGVQVAALGDGKFSALGFQDGLPGNGWDRETTIHWNGARQSNVLTFKGPRGTIVIREGGGTIIDSAGIEVGRVQKVRRISSTLGAAPPAGAVTLFSGSSTEAFENGKFSPDGALAPGALTRLRVNDFQLHLEFLIPYMPQARDQSRGNSGVYIQHRYEVQILDSFGLPPEFNGCGALYRQQTPDLNMSFPPLAWQTYDIYFTAPRWDPAGNKTADARLTVFHNGVAIHSDQSVPTKTGAGKPESPDDGPILLQDHGDPVQYRNIWIVTLPDSPLATEQPRKQSQERAEFMQQIPQAIAPVDQWCQTEPSWIWSAAPSGRHAPGPTSGWILWKGRYPYP